ncbi:MAG: hypothetical protein IKX40_09560 [Thermoguttaceae bacterium]|nr:hypothetical protein [Thermoguttaceae bacterium]
MPTDINTMDNDASENQETQTEKKQLPQLLLDNDPDARLETLFPRPGRYFSWNRFRKEAHKGGWSVPQLKQNAVIDKLVWLAFDLFMYSCITLFLFGILFFFGERRPLGEFTPYLELFCLGYAALYVIFLFVATGIEMVFGLYTFPDGVETVEQLKQLITRQEEQEESSNE